MSCTHVVVYVLSLWHDTFYDKNCLPYCQEKPGGADGCGEDGEESDEDDTSELDAVLDMCRTRLGMSDGASKLAPGPNAASASSFVTTQLLHKRARAEFDGAKKRWLWGGNRLAYWERGPVSVSDQCLLPYDPQSM